MKKKYTVCIILSLVLMFSFSAFAVKPSDKQVNASKPVTADRTEVLKSRFLNMLNHNFAYGEALDYNVVIQEESYTYYNDILPLQKKRKTGILK